VRRPPLKVELTEVGLCLPAGTGTFVSEGRPEPPRKRQLIPRNHSRSASSASTSPGFSIDRTPSSQKLVTSQSSTSAISIAVVAVGFVSDHGGPRRD
jgi:hypothetical protein